MNGGQPVRTIFLMSGKWSISVGTDPHQDANHAEPIHIAGDVYRKPVFSIHATRPLANLREAAA